MQRLVFMHVDYTAIINYERKPDNNFLSALK